MQAIFDILNSAHQSGISEISDEEALAAVERMARAKEAILGEVGKIIVGQTG